METDQLILVAVILLFINWEWWLSWAMKKKFKKFAKNIKSVSLFFYIINFSSQWSLNLIFTTKHHLYVVGPPYTTCPLWCKGAILLLPLLLVAIKIDFYQCRFNDVLKYSVSWHSNIHLARQSVSLSAK